jgi:creatinine amidohydrolase
MRPYILAETNWDALKNETFDLAILPWGATEAHNYHLPYSTDNIEADLISAESAKLAWEAGAKVIVLPTIPFGVNTGQRDIYLDININPSTQFAILSDIIDVLNHHKIFRLLILNSHGGNEFKPIARELGSKYPCMFICISNWYQILNKKEYFDNPGDHADEMETSLMHRIKAFNEGWVWAERKWPEITDDTGIGNPKLATAEKGSKYFHDLTDKISKLVVELCKADPVNMYE